MKITIIFVAILVLLPLIAAETIGVEFPSNDNTFEPEEGIKFVVNIYDSNQQPIYNQDVLVVVEDQGKNVRKEETVKSGTPVVINLGEKAASGQGKITTTYGDLEPTISFFEIGEKELLKFELKDSILTITNIGNTLYEKEINIIIGNTKPSTKQPNLGIGKSVSYRLIAPEGVYSITVDDGTNKQSWLSVPLSGATGNVVAAVDDSASQRTGITGGISPDEQSNEALLSYIQKNKFVYVFIFVIFGAMILLAIERRFKKKTGK